MPGLSDGANLAIALVVVLGIGYLIFRIDRRVKQRGALLKRDASPQDTIDALKAEFNLPDDIKGQKWGIRALAYIIDFAVIYGFNTAAGFLFGVIFFAIFSFIMTLIGKSFYVYETESRLLIWSLGIFLDIIYFTVFEWIYTGSFGKIALGIRVVNLEGTKCNLRQAFIRAIYRIIDGLVFGFVAYAKMRPPLYQRHGDVKAKTIVVHRNATLIKQQLSWPSFLSAALIYFILAGIIQIMWILPGLRI